MRRPEKNKSPLHPSALSLSDLHAGRRIIRFNIAFGNGGSFEVVSEPFMGYLGTADGKHASYENQPKNLIVILRDIQGGFTTTHDVGDLGVHPYNEKQNHWNDRNFVIDAHKAHLLPEPNKGLAAIDNAELDEMLCFAPPVYTDEYGL